MTTPLLSSYTGWPIIIGSGLAGLSVALHLNEPCLLISPYSFGKGSSTQLAQGGMSAAIGLGDTPLAHANDTIRTGGDLCDKNIVTAITQAAPHAVDTLLKWGVPLARHDANLALHLEGAHSAPRVVYAGGDQSGACITSALWENIQKTPRIHVLTGASLEGFHVNDGTLQGVWTSAGFISTSRCIIATGSCGGLYKNTTIPLNNKGLGLAYAAQAGARLADMEFTQFHPTALAAGSSHAQRSLISEAVRGAGAILVRDDGEQFVDELAPRDIVSRAIAAQLKAGHEIFLDGRSLNKQSFSDLFPSITAACNAVGLNPNTDRLPVKPAMHYHMGGIAVNQQGRSSLPGLWACGEVACTGLHGANRLASNSLLEALVCGQWVAEDINASSSIHSPIQKPRLRSPVLSYDWNLHELMESKVGLIRTQSGLENFLNITLPLIHSHASALTASFIAWAALNRAESRGSHWRDDAPYTLSPQRQSWILTDLPSSL